MKMSAAEKKSANQSSWLISLGVSVDKVEPPAETPKQKRIGRSKDFDFNQKEALYEHIRKAIKSGIIHYLDIWAHFEDIEENSEELILLRSKSDGKLMSTKTFRDYVNRVKREISFRPISKKEIVLRLHKAGRSDQQIKKESGISLVYINRVLVVAGHRKSDARWYKDFLFKELEKTNNEPASV